MTLTKVQVINEALALIGESPISDVLESTARAAAANSHWDAVRHDVLGRLDWQCAVKRANLSQHATAPLFEYAYAYTLPSDFIRLVEIYDVTTGTYISYAHPDASYQIEWHEGFRSIITSRSPLQVRYVFDLTDTTLMSSSMQKAIAAKLAARLAKRLTGQSNLVASMEAMYQHVLGEAGLEEGEQRPLEHIPHGTWTRARFQYPRDWRREEDV